ncbi:MAG: RidA family protein [Planctomycetes bacterium]|nr:RidA family protein [Planctomycetota bacterium]
MTERRIVATDGAPKAIGPYSQAVIAGGFVHCSGQIPLDPQTMQIVGGDIAAQTERVLRNLAAVLGAAGSEMARVVRCTVYLTDMAHFPAMNEVYAKHFPAQGAPARSTVAVAGLPHGALVEIDCIALV